MPDIERFHVEEIVGDNALCLSRDNWMSELISFMPIGFLEVFDLKLGDYFDAQIDRKGKILLETIVKIPKDTLNRSYA